MCSASKKNNTNLPSVEKWCKNQRWAGRHGTDLVHRPNLTKQSFSFLGKSLEIQHLSTRAGDLLYITGWCELDPELHTALMWWPQVWIQFGIWSNSYHLIHMKMRPSLLLFPFVATAVVCGCASTSLLLHPCKRCLTTGN